MDTITQLLFATFIPAQPFVMTSTTISASTAMSTTASVVDDSDLLTTSTIGVSTTSSASLVGVKEGYDPQADGEAPEGANLQLGVEINAYEI